MDISSKIIKKKLTNENIFILLIFFIIIFLRFYKVPQFFFFDIDEEYQSLLALSIIKDLHIVWIGLSAANTGFYIGPGLVYLHSLLLWVAKLDPVILGYAASFIGCLTTVVFFFIVKYLFDKKTATLSSILYALSSFVIFYDRRFWNSTLVPLTTILTYYSLVKLKKNSRWLLLLAFLVGLSFHIHASLFIFIPIILFTIYRYIMADKLRLTKLNLIIASIVFLIVYSPLIVFDIVHNFDNLKTPLRLLMNLDHGEKVSIIIENIIVLKSTLGKFWLNINHSIILSLVLFGVSLLILIWFILRRKNSQEKVLAIIIVFYLFSFIFYPGKILDYYYLGFLPFFAIVGGVFFKKLNTYLLSAVLGIFIVVNTILIIKKPQETGLSAKKQLIKKVMTVVDNRSYYLQTNHQYLYFGGWRYLFEAYGKKPGQSQADEMFGWIYPKEISKTKPELKVIITDVKIKIKNKPIKIINVGKYYSYILNNQ